MSFVPFAFIPWVLYFARIGETDLRGAIGVGATLALMAIEGGTYPVPFAIVALAVTETPRMFTRAVGPVRVARLAAESTT